MAAALTSTSSETWTETLPQRGYAGILGLILTESAFFSIFVVAYIFYSGKSLSGPFPRDVLSTPVVNTICLLSSSVTIVWAIRSLHRGSVRGFALWWLITFVLGLEFLMGTAFEWHRLIYHVGFTISTNLFGTTFYSLVGLHALHVVVGLFMILVVLGFALTRTLHPRHAERVKVLSLYWHFVDAVWVVVFTVVYVIGR